ncbi:PIR Superfamily Protein [Plasmodium ovale wallikeri]|uniref:PIR Superfamily Protein n=2 Tax=Plasmodium ovale TaxID=36330 RepID=A0A1A9ANL9_PLAOA|nr:PIR Superfamily Protein [Plasmodium ovale wallikeri]SBT59018.1 PIR Superfamily Protein [Plasmodium ovale wallikeri]SBT74180.1 PIR protein [Plasmodium ovale]
MHDFSKDYEKYKIELINADITCNANYKNYFDNNIENYKKLHSFCGVEKNQDTHGIVFRTLFPEKNHRILPTLSCNHEETSRRKQLLSDKDDRQLFPQAQASGHEPVTQLDQAYGTFPEAGSAPQSDESITRHFQTIMDVTFSAEILHTLFILYIVIRISLKILVLYIALCKLFS